MNINNLTRKQILMNAFSFRYGGIATVEILPIRTKYQVITTGFDIQDGLVWFNHPKPIRRTKNTLYEAIKLYNELVQKICETTEYFSDDFFQESNLRKYLSTRIYS